MISNTLYQGDNLKILRENIPAESFDLVYLDPPFGSNRNYSVDGAGSKAPATFIDTWKWDESSEQELNRLNEFSPAVGTLVRAILDSTGINPVTTYLIMMAPRLVEIYRVMKESGSLYLHCDPTSSHYLKIILDTIFSEGRFRNEIVWAYKGGGRSKKAFARKHDIILYYSKGNSWTFNYEDIMVDRTNRTWFTDEDGKRYWLKYGKRYYLKHDGKVPEDWWTDIDPLHGPYNERLGYPTQKPLSLLDRIIRASSNPEDAVLDPFCGCGTTLVAAQQLGRNWTGIDISPEAIAMTNQRLLNFDQNMKLNLKRV